MKLSIKTPDFKFALRALKYRNYRLFFSGQIVSLIGTWLTTVATNWLVYRLAKQNGASAAHAALILGAVGFASQIPQLLLAPISGAWVDRLSRHKVLVATQFLSMMQSFALAYLALRGTIQIPAIVFLNFFQGVVNSFDMPARQSLTVDLVEKREDLGNAIALSSSMVHGARLIGPAIAGVLIYRFGEGSCFLIDGFSYLAVLIALLQMRLTPRQEQPHAERLIHLFQEGFRYAFGFLPIRVLLMLIAATSLFTMSLQTLMPVFANDVLHGNERVYGLLLCASGAGALLATFYLAGRRSVVGLGRVIAYCNLTLGIGLVCFALSHALWLSMSLLVITGCAMVLQVASANTIIQTIVDDSKRGRVMSLFGVSFLGMMPIGSLLVGFVAGLVGPAWTMGLSGAGCIVSAYIFSRYLPLFRKHVIPVYVKMGLLPTTLLE